MKPTWRDPDSRAQERRPPIQRLLFIADAAVADTDELPTAVRAVIDAAAELYVVTPTLPGRLAWLADDVDRFRHIADKRLDAVLDHMLSIGAHVTARRRGSVMTVITDAVEEFGRTTSSSRCAARARQLAGAQADRPRRGTLRTAGHNVRCRPGRAHIDRRRPVAPLLRRL